MNQYHDFWSGAQKASLGLGGLCGASYFTATSLAAAGSASWTSLLFTGVTSIFMGAAIAAATGVLATGVIWAVVSVIGTFFEMLGEGLSEMGLLQQTHACK